MKNKFDIMINDIIELIKKQKYDNSYESYDELLSEFVSFKGICIRKTKILNLMYTENLRVTHKGDVLLGNYSSFGGWHISVGFDGLIISEGLINDYRDPRKLIHRV